MDAIELMMEEHKNIKRGLSLFRKMSIAVLEGKQVDYDDFNTMIGFVRNYADKHHHNKEESILFKKMQDDLRDKGAAGSISGMFIEHDLGRLYMKSLEEALNRVKNGDSDSRVDVIANAIGYADLLNRHIEKEDKVMYKFAERALSASAMENINKRCGEVEKSAQEREIQKKYLNDLMTLEKKWGS